MRRTVAGSMPAAGPEGRKVEKMKIEIKLRDLAIVYAELGGDVRIGSVLDAVEDELEVARLRADDAKTELAARAVLCLAAEEERTGLQDRIAALEAEVDRLHRALGAPTTHTLTKEEVALLVAGNIVPAGGAPPARYTCGNKILVIKSVRGRTDLDLRGSKDLVDAYVDTIGDALFTAGPRYER